MDDHTAVGRRPIDHEMFQIGAQLLLGGAPKVGLVADPTAEAVLDASVLDAPVPAGSDEARPADAAVDDDAPIHAGAA